MASLEDLLAAFETSRAAYDEELSAAYGDRDLIAGRVTEEMVRLKARMGLRRRGLQDPEVLKLRIKALISDAD